MYGHTLGQALGMGYVEADEGVTKEYVASGRFEIEIACRRVPAVASLQAFYDPRTFAYETPGRCRPRMAASFKNYTGQSPKTAAWRVLKRASDKAPAI